MEKKKWRVLKKKSSSTTQQNRHSDFLKGEAISTLDVKGKMQLEYRTHTMLGSDESKSGGFCSFKVCGQQCVYTFGSKRRKENFWTYYVYVSNTRCVGNINLPPDVHIWWQIYNLCSSPSTAGQTVMLLEQMGAAVVVIVLGGDGGLNASL